MSIAGAFFNLFMTSHSAYEMVQIDSNACVVSFPPVRGAFRKRGGRRRRTVVKGRPANYLIRSLNKTKAAHGTAVHLHIFLRRNKCSYKLEFSAGRIFFFLPPNAMQRHQYPGIHTRESVEIAEVYAHPHDGELAIDSMKLDFPSAIAASANCCCRS